MLGAAGGLLLDVLGAAGGYFMMYCARQPCRHSSDTGAALAAAALSRLNTTGYMPACRCPAMLRNLLFYPHAAVAFPRLLSSMLAGWLGPANLPAVATY
jgi:hypothetical protein